jgi:carbonic anhydrase/acetyltransferase-like protein (isoleucine patch superfamily)
MDPALHSPFGMPFRMRYVRGIYLAESAVVTGDVTIGKDSNLWPFVSARGDVAPIRVGEGCSVQDHVMLHCKHNVPLEIGDHVLIGHQACVHCTRVGSWTLIGIGARVLDDAEVGENCIVAAGAVVTPGTKIPDGKLVAGVPAKVLRDVSEKDRAYIREVVTRYVDLARAHVAGKFAPYA